jgi:hypothetical protein
MLYIEVFWSGNRLYPPATLIGFVSNQYKNYRYRLRLVFRKKKPCTNIYKFKIKVCHEDSLYMFK